MKRILLAAVAAAPLALALAQPSLAQSEREEHMRRLHYECDRGDRRACVQFGVMIGEQREHHAEWQRSHPEWWWWQR
jgi:hypothetical protein